MTHIMVNDASCLIDLRKGRLLHLLQQLSYEFVIPLPVRETELIQFSAQDWQTLDDILVCYDLSSEEVRAAMTLRQNHHTLSANDCFCLITAEVFENGILLTGDRRLRKCAEARNIEVHGVLWIVDQLARVLSNHRILIDALNLWRYDPSVHLPIQEITTRLADLKNK